MTQGIVLSVAAAVSYTFNTLFLTFLGRKAGITATKHIFLVALAANLLIHLGLYGRLFPRFERIEYLLYLAAPGIVGYVLGHITMISALGLIGPVLSVFLNFNALKFISLGISSAMLQLSPVLMLFLSRIVFKERIKAIAIAGIALAVSGTILLILH